MKIPASVVVGMIVRNSIGIPYDSIDIEDAGKTAAEITGRRDVKTVPQIYVEGEYIGGYDDLMKWLSGGTLQSEEGEECRACEG